MAATESSPTLLSPVSADERIHAMDVLRGFALLGIALMNVEYFNRSSAELGAGVAAGEGGTAHIVSWLMLWLVGSKFWVLFSLLFGMGFALMLQRARARGGNFLGVYTRRTLALLAIGLVHAIGIWFGDVLVDYAVIAAMLMLLWFGRFRHGLLLSIAMVAITFIPGMASAGSAVMLVVLAMVAGDWIRAPEGRMPRGLWLLFALGAALALAGLMQASSDAGRAAAFGLVGGLLVVLGWVASRSRAEPRQRPLRAGIALYLLMPVIMMLGAGVLAAKPGAFMPSNEEGRKEMAENFEKHRADSAAEVAAMRSPSYMDDIRVRIKHLRDTFGMLSTMGTMILGVFLVGGWLLDRGVIAEPQAHARFWHRLLLAWPVCAAVAAFALWLAPRMPIDRPLDAREMLGMGLGLAIALPMTLGYVAMILRGLQGRLAPLLQALAPAGRMALTNYLMQSVVCAFVFYGWGLHQWGMPRHLQVLFVLAMYAAQVLLSALWLRHFRYGPMEWLWRWLTYGRRPQVLAASPASAA